MTCRLRFFLDNPTQAPISVSVLSGISLHEAAARAGLPLRKNCGGQGTCGQCKVMIDGQERLACRTAVDRDLDIVVPRSSLGIEKISVTTESSNVSIGSVACDRDPSYQFGIALDIGTTTLAADILCLSETPLRVLATVGRANPQRRFGDDVISRIQKIIEDPTGLAEMQTLILDAVGEMFHELAQSIGMNTAEIALLSVSGNTVMEHIFLGIDPSPLGLAPFKAPVSEFPVCRGHEIGFHANPECVIETMPIFAGFVGGDIVAGVSALGLPEADATALFLDIGTNGEMVLCHHGELFTAVTAAGPAFEGGRIEFGMTASAGAIDKAAFHEDGTVTLSTIAGVPAKGICGSGLIDVVSEMLRHGLIGPNGRFQVKPDSPFLSRWKIIDDQPAFELVPREESGRKEAILLTQRDIRQLQLATGAIHSGIILLLRQRNLTVDEIDTFYVAGGFGSFIKPEAAQRIGLLPKTIPLERVRFCGNTSLAGARLALVNTGFRAAASELARRAKHVELATLPDFATVFAESMIF